MWTFVRWKPQPLQDLFDPRSVRKTPVIRAPARRSQATNGGFGSREEQRGGSHPLLFGRQPDRLAAPPRPILRVVRVSIVEVVVPRRVIKLVADDAVARRIHPGRNRVVAGKGQRGKHRNQRIGHRARRGQPVEARCVETVEVVVPEPVERDENDVVAVDDLRVVGAARSIRSLYRGGRLSRSRAGAGTAGDDKRNADNDRKDAASSHDRC